MYLFVLLSCFCNLLLSCSRQHESIPASATEIAQTNVTKPVPSSELVADKNRAPANYSLAKAPFTLTLTELKPTWIDKSAMEDMITNNTVAYKALAETRSMTNELFLLDKDIATITDKLRTLSDNKHFEPSRFGGFVEKFDRFIGVIVPGSLGDVPYNAYFIKVRSGSIILVECKEM